MKPEDTKTPFPKTASDWDALVKAAPGSEEAASPLDDKKSVVTRSGGFAGVRAGLEASRRRGERGPQKAPTKERISIRLSQEVVDQFRATGSGWQTRIDSALKEWLREHPAAQ